MEEKPNEYIITYSNHLEFEGVKLAFRHKLLFDISSTPKYIPFNFEGKYWLIKNKQLTISKYKELIKKEEVKVDVSNLQWYAQCHLDECFNL